MLWRRVDRGAAARYVARMEGGDLLARLAAGGRRDNARKEFLERMVDDVVLQESVEAGMSAEEALRALRAHLLLLHGAGEVVALHQVLGRLWLAARRAWGEDFAPIPDPEGVRAKVRL